MMFEMFFLLEISDVDIQDFLFRLNFVYWLDSGYVGDRNVWLIDDKVLFGMV